MSANPNPSGLPSWLELNEKNLNAGIETAKNPIVQQSMQSAFSAALQGTLILRMLLYSCNIDCHYSCLTLN